MSVLAFFLTTLISVLALTHLARKDAKRQRVLGAERPTDLRRVPLARFASLAPGLVLAVMGDWVAFVLWLAAISLAGWVIAAVPASVLRGLSFGYSVDWRRPIAVARRYRDYVRGLLAMPSRIAALEARVAELEAEMAGQRDETAADVEELPQQLGPKPVLASDLSRAS